MKITIVIFVISLISGFALADSKELKGMVPYTPSRIEWLAMRSQAKYVLDDIDILKYSISINEVKNENVILISVNYDSKSEKILPKIKDYVDEVIKSSIVLEAKKNNWDWLVVKTHYQKETDFFEEFNK